MGYRNHHSTFGAADGTPLVVSSRFGELNGHTLDGYKDTGSYTGYAALNQILSMAPSQVLSTVRDATLLGRGGAGFPRASNGASCPPTCSPATSWSTATSPNRAPIRIASSWSATHIN